MEPLLIPSKSNKHKGALRGTAHVLKTVAKDPSSRRSIQRFGNGTKTVGRVVVGVGNEIARDQEVRQAARHTGWLALKGAGVIRYDAKTGKHVPNAKGIESALAFPELALRGAIVAGRKGTPNLVEAAVKATPYALRNYHRENPGALRGAASATVEVVKGSITLPFYLGVAAVNGIREVRASNRALEEDAAKYRGSVLTPDGGAPVSNFTVHTANGPVRMAGVPDSPEHPVQQSTGQPVSALV
jgi:hypothetical protein